VRKICRNYHASEEVPYHNVEHAYHVFLSANKLLDLMLCEQEEVSEPSTEMMDDSTTADSNNNDDESNYIMVAGRRRRRGRSRRATTESTGSGTTSSSSSRSNSKRRRKRRRNPTFGIKSDPLSQLALLFSALVHDVDHTGITNRQLVLEMDDLAILYNDQSVAEQRSLAVAFLTLKGGEYQELREVLFPPPPTSVGRGDDDTENNGHREGGSGASGKATSVASGGVMLGNEDFFKFRKLVIDLVLVTDIASPERTQIVKSKWKEAFGEVIVAEKLRKSMMPNACNSGGAKGGGGGGGGTKGGGRIGATRGTSIKSGHRGKPNRRISFDSDVL